MGEGLDVPPLPVTASAAERAARYELVASAIKAVLAGEDDWVAAMATVACLLHEAFEYFHWTGFYQAGTPGKDTLVIGPYQGHMGCLRIPYNRGVCGAAARTRSTQPVPNVSQFPGYIACASSTQSEVVVPVLGPSVPGSHDAGQGRLLLAVLDVDSDHPAAFTEVDKQYLEELCAWLGQQVYR
ncbi:hypothetical protein HYH02_009595 [Chlamydomonas schloesseri]|uniref:GAF domain-containing protein n=1 Tax=Chlamydomonas schloesseri TaxID=2026947 RepID=A0A835W9R8_9CHLO|nr:hypothetical protein HYH02_009595 [Chlamydomonas schloesseri]|eukprot:KAG2442106.1 hypothetical protein HYH02_009595 [Chlamydomonas schloesseri]